MRQYLFTEKRLPNVILVFTHVLYPFTYMMAQYRAYRDDAIIRANITVSKMSIEWYLNHKFDPELKRIYIETNRRVGLPLGVRGDAADDDFFAIMGDRYEAGDDDYFAIMTMEREHTQMGFSSFGVFVPTALIDQSDAIAGVVETYSMNDFVIIEF